MKDPNEKSEANPDTNHPERASEKENSGWDQHQQIDEEGNEVAPDDVK
ncbi:hypothetical protein [Pedobacter sp. JY14-1]|nr:hypothetical protein [Pedobacter sp. JY14-1]